MNQTEELKRAITALFLEGTDEEHNEDEMLELIEDVDYDAVRQAFDSEGRRFYEFEVMSDVCESMNYRSLDLFGMRALVLERLLVFRVVLSVSRIAAPLFYSNRLILSRL